MYDILVLSVILRMQLVSTMVMAAEGPLPPIHSEFNEMLVEFAKIVVCTSLVMITSSPAVGTPVMFQMGPLKSHPGERIKMVQSKQERDI